MSVSMSDSQFTTLRPKFVDKKGNAAEVQNIEWSTDNTDVLALEPSADGKECKVSAVGPLSPSSSVTMKADADLGDGVVPLVGTVEFAVTAGQATTVQIDADTPAEQP